MFWKTTVLASLLAASARADDGIPGRRVALLVGINAYQKPTFDDLKYAERDVEEVGRELKSLGFEVTTLTGSNATRQAIDETALQLVRPLAKSDVMLVMLCGHGLQLDVQQPDGSTRNDAFFCPYDAVANDTATLFSLTRLIDVILGPHVGRKLVLVDACRNEADPSRGSRGVDGKVIALPEETAVMFSCRKGQKSFENDELRHGLFSYCLIEGLRGEGAIGNDIDWSGLSTHVTRRMASRDFVDKYLVGGGAQQQPIATGGVPHTILGRLDVRPKALASTTPLATPPSLPNDTTTPMKSAPLNFKMNSLEGKEVNLADYQGKVVLIVNVASQCGATPQYAGLQDLYAKYKDRGLVVLGFPCNQFGGQEPGSAKEIREFCTKEYSVTFPMFAKVDVKGEQAAPLYKHITSKASGLPQTGDIGWNFEKFLIGKDGKPVARFDTSIEPEQLEDRIQQELAK